MGFKSLITVAIFVFVGLFAWVFVRLGKPARIPASELRYPCLRITDGRMWEVIETPESIGEMHSDLYMNRENEPWMIDTDFRVVEMAKLKMRGNSPTFLITGPRRLELEYELVLRPEKSKDDALKMIKELVVNVPFAPSEEIIAQATTLREFIDLLYISRQGRFKPLAD